MITFESIRWKNFLSTGDQWTEIQLDESSSTLIVGTNGAGKSTMLDALCFALFNKPFRKINKGQLVNSINEKGTKVEVCFSIGKETIVCSGESNQMFLNYTKIINWLTRTPPVRTHKSTLNNPYSNLTLSHLPKSSYWDHQLCTLHATHCCTQTRSN